MAKHLRYVGYLLDLANFALEYRPGVVRRSEKEFNDFRGGLLQLGARVVRFKRTDTLCDKRACDFSQCMSGNEDLEDFTYLFSTGRYYTETIRAYYGTENKQVKEINSICDLCLNREMMMQMISSAMRASRFPIFTLSINGVSKQVLLLEDHGSLIGIRLGSNRYYLVVLDGEKLLLYELFGKKMPIFFSSYYLDEGVSRIFNPMQTKIASRPSLAYISRSVLFVRSGNKNVGHIDIRQVVETRVIGGREKIVQVYDHNMRLLKPVPNTTSRYYQIEVLKDIGILKRDCRCKREWKDEGYWSDDDEDKPLSNEDNALGTI